ncbi:MAG: hypothetical protein AAGB31_00790 [Bdellovibrio sp.]
MRYFAFVLIVITSSFASAFQSLSGTVTRTSSDLYIVISNAHCSRYLLVGANEDADNSIRKLSAGDILTASGTLHESTCKASLTSVDYVGLKKLLGYWYSNEGIFTVRDFNYMSFYPMNIKNAQSDPEYYTGDPISYRYSITPSEGKEWVMFLSDKESTTFATLQMYRGYATMRIYDSDTGQMKKTLRLSKWGELK